MLPGIGGSLIAGAFLRDVLLAEFRASDRPAATRRKLTLLHQWSRRSERLLGPASSARAIVDIAALPLAELLGYTVLALEPHARGFVGTLGVDGAATAVLRTTTWGADADAAWRDAVRAGRTAGTRWGLVYTGSRLRIVDAARTWSRRALEFDIPVALTDERSAIAFWTLSCSHSLSSAETQLSLATLVRRSDAHAVSVCASLGGGVLAAVTDLLGALDQVAREAGRAERETFEQAVTIVYRLLFLLFAEARALVPTWHQVYREAYTIQALCRRITERPAAHGLWPALQAISRLAHAGCRAGDLIVTPFNGRLFSPRHTPLAEKALVPDATVGRAVVSLATAPAGDGRRFISYADLGVEQLGAVYERVLEYEPSRGRSRGPLTLSRTSHERKSTGSFYTPRAMTDFLVRRTLHPLVAGRSADAILALRVVDPAMGSGAFLVAACRYLASSAERALRAEGDWADEDRTSERRAELRRIVGQRCLYGVDLNPVAVQLARLSIWLTTLASDRPLTFLDHHLLVGDSLLGAGLQDLARSPSRQGQRVHQRHRPPPLFAEEAVGEMASLVLPDRFRLACEPGDTPAAVRDKERALAALVAPGTPLSRWKLAADLWCARFFGADVTAGIYHDVLSALLQQPAALPECQRAAVLSKAEAIGHDRRFFHWDLEFPEIFFDVEGRRTVAGGFDAVIGNPPWDVLRADAGIQSVEERDRRRESLRFFRDAGIYRLQGRGHVNRYQLFLERALQLTRSGGRLGLVLPSGLATDQGSGFLRRALLDSVHVDRLVGFDNRKGIFPIHRDVKFLLLTGTKGDRTERLICSFGRTDSGWLDELPDRAADDPPSGRAITVSRSLLESLDPEHLAIPLLTQTMDLEVLSQICSRTPRLANRDGWNARFGRELNATDDRSHFVARSRTVGDDKLLPVIEGKHLEPFRVFSDSSALAIPARTAATLLDPAHTFGRRRLAYRDVASATNRLTIVAALLPSGSVSTHTVFCLKTLLGGASQYCLLALVNSLVANYLVRLQVTTHVTAAVMARLPVPRPRSDSQAFRELAALGRSLERTGIAEDEDSYVRVNTIAAHLYALSSPQYEHIVGTFPLLEESFRAHCVRDYEQATEAWRHGR